MLKGTTHSEEAKLKQSIVKKGKRMSVTTKFKKGMVPWNKGKKLSSEYKAKLSESHKGIPSARKGAKLTEDQKEKISLANKGNKHTADTKSRISFALKGREVSQETRNKLSQVTHVSGWKHNEESKNAISVASREYYSDENVRNRRRVQLLQRIKSTPPNGFEKYVGDRLTNFGLEFEFQFIADDRFAFDYRIVNKKILIECDCDYWHRNRIVQDANKSSWAQTNGFKLVRIDYESAVFNKSYVDDVLKREVLA